MKEMLIFQYFSKETNKYIFNKFKTTYFIVHSLNPPEIIKENETFL